MNLIFIITYALWILSEIVINRLFGSGKSDGKNLDKSSLAFIWAMIFIGIFAAVYLSARYDYPISRNPNIRYAGLILIYTGIILRLAVIRSLGPYFTVDVSIRERHQLKKDGFYKYLRHPSYSASLLSFIGFGVSLNNWLSLAVLFTLVFIAFSVRMKVEEKALTDYFGEEYEAYKKETKRILPFIY